MQNRFRAGDLVRVRSASEIRDTLDAHDRLDSVPFMPEMLRWCGNTFRVSSTAHKSCDTVNKTGGRSLNGTVHLDDLRCDGSAHGGCNAHCLIFWKEAWLVPATERSPRNDTPAEHAITAGPSAKSTQESDRFYTCQATELPRFSAPLPWWNPRQYIDDVRGGNHKASTILRLGTLKFVQNRLERGIAFRFFLRLYNALQGPLGGEPRSADDGGRIQPGDRTPVEAMDLQPGEYVEVKQFEEIRETLDRVGKNRGMRFDIEMTVHCGKRFRVAKRVEKIIDEQTGELVALKTPSIILDGAVCLAKFSAHRMFCPRALPQFWREIWLKRVPNGEIPLRNLNN